MKVSLSPTLILVWLAILSSVLSASSMEFASPAPPTSPCQLTGLNASAATSPTASIVWFLMSAPNATMDFNSPEDPARSASMDSR